MPTVIEKLKEKQLIARRARETDEAALLTTVIGECEKIGKDAGNRLVTDDECLSVIRKFVKNINETISYLKSEDERLPGLKVEKDILSGFLPAMLSEDEIRAEIIAMIRKNPDITFGGVMGSLSKNFKGLFDGRVAQSLAKEELS